MVAVYRKLFHPSARWTVLKVPPSLPLCRQDQVCVIGKATAVVPLIVTGTVPAHCAYPPVAAPTPQPVNRSTRLAPPAEKRVASLRRGGSLGGRRMLAEQPGCGWMHRVHPLSLCVASNEIRIVQGVREILDLQYNPSAIPIVHGRGKGLLVHQCSLKPPAYAFDAPVATTERVRARAAIIAGIVFGAGRAAPWSRRYVVLLLRRVCHWMLCW